MATDAPGPRRLATPEVRTWRDAEGVEWCLVHCPACGTDLSTVCLGRLAASPVGLIVEFFHPFRCPECRAPLLPVPPARRIIPAARLPTA